MKPAADPPSDSAPLARRTVSVWLLLIAAWALGAVFSAGVAKHLFEAVTGSSVARSLINAAILAAVSAYLIGLALSVQRRRRWAARTLGTLFLVVFGLAVAFGPGAPSSGCASTEACVQGWWLGRLLLAALFIGWAVAAGWSPGSKKYYAVGSATRAGEA